LYERASEILDPVHAAADEADVELEETVIEGIAHETLIDYTKAKGIDLIVIGTHGKTGISRVLLGSTAEKVVRHSPVPVMTVRDGDDD
jgi:nucleotide-binding universal stress UspA family protein